MHEQFWVEKGMQLIFQKITKYQQEKMNKKESRKMEASLYLDECSVNLQSQEHLEISNAKSKVTPQTKIKSNSLFAIQK